MYTEQKRCEEAGADSSFFCYSSYFPKTFGSLRSGFDREIPHETLISVDRPANATHRKEKRDATESGDELGIEAAFTCTASSDNMSSWSGGFWL